MPRYIGRSLNTSILCLLVLATAPNNALPRTAAAPSPFATALQFDAAPGRLPEPIAIRGQTPTYDEDPTRATDFSQGGAYVPTDPGAFQQTPPYQSDPFMGVPPGGGGYDPNSDPNTFGIYGPQPYHYGWSSYYSAGWLPSESTQGVAGKFEVLEVDAALRHVSPLPSGLIFAFSPLASYRSWQGPGGVALPANVYRLGADFELTAAGASPWSAQLGFTPQVVSDFDSSLNSDAYSFDARGILYYRASPQWLFAFGAGFWDRVKDRVIPYAGVVWTPDDRWEFRLLFPKSRISYFLGDFNGRAMWFYGSAEFNSEAYQVTIEDTGIRDRVELSDYRLLLGIRSERGGVSTFIEGGWVLDRQVNFKGPTTDFDVSDGWLLRGGIRF